MIHTSSRLRVDALVLGCTIAAILVLTVTSLSAALLNKEERAAKVFATTYGTEPDKWASAWLISRHLYPGAEITVSEAPALSPETRAAKTESLKNPVKLPRSPQADASAEWFDVPHAQWVRTRTKLTYQQVLESGPLSDPVLSTMGELLHGIEQLSWTTAFSPDQETVEMGYRALQQHFYPQRVPIPCYFQFFDAVYEGLSKNALPELHGWITGLEGGWNLCRQQKDISRLENVPSVSLKTLERMLERSEPVVFVDTREPQEFAAKHIPGAINVPLRRLNDVDVSVWKEARLVVPYCIKDFRGYEVARRLRALGLTNVAMMQPHGLHGWLKNGLPVEGHATDSIDQPERTSTAKAPKSI